MKATSLKRQAARNDGANDVYRGVWVADLKLET